MNKATSPVHLWELLMIVLTPHYLNPLQFSKGALELESVRLFRSCKLSGMCHAADWVYVRKVNHPGDHRAGSSSERLPGLFSLGLSLLSPRWRVSLPLGRTVCITLSSIWVPCVAEKIHVEAEWVFAMDFVHEVLAHVNSETFNVSYVISQRIPEWWGD